jgi:hypothetical protein
MQGRGVAVTGSQPSATRPIEPHHRRALLLVFSAGVLWLVASLATAGRYPQVTCDEAFYARSALAYVHAVAQGHWWPAEGVMFYLPHGRTYWLMLGSALAAFGQTIVAARVVSIVGWAGLIAATYAIGAVYASRKVGVWSAALTAVAWLALHAGHRARPDILAAAGAAVLVALARPIARRGRWLELLALGAALVLILDLHPIALYVTLPLAALAAGWLIRGRHYGALAALIAGLILGGVALLALHFGPLLGPVLRLAVADPAALIGSQGVLGQGAKSPLLVAALSSFARFWWRYYAWFAGPASLPQGVLFVVGLVAALVGCRPELRTLAGLIVVSSVLFAVVNAGYTAPPGYAVLWLPLYMVLGVAVLLDWAEHRPWQIERLGWGESVLGLLWIATLAGSVYLILSQPASAYAHAAAQIESVAESDDRVLAPSVWWFALKDDLTFLDETLIAPEGSGLWWNAVPDTEGMALASLDLPRSNDLSADAAADRAANALIALQPDIVFEDGVIGCQVDQTALSAALADAVEAACESGQVLDLPDGYGSPTTYTCSWP